MARDLGKLEDDMGSIEALRGKRKMVGAGGGMGRSGAPVPPVAAPRPRPNPADAGVFTADKGIQPPSPDEGPTMGGGMPPRGMPPRRPMPGMKKGGCVKKAKGGSVGSASKRADGIATKGKTKGRVI